jgi:nicotinate-nucleotide pyrophosphorylase (carboxylating)
VREVVARALAEDLTPLGDVTTSLLPPGATARAAIVPREPGVLAGRMSASETFVAVDPELVVEWSADDGDELRTGVAVATISGPLAPILTAERTVLNLLCHLSGIATLTRQYVTAAGTARIRDTRKTTPGLRALEKAAVRAGGGVNHRGNLSDGILLKDNHLAGLTIVEAVARSRERWPGRAIEVECDRLDQVKVAVDCRAEMILCDNMTPDEVAECVAIAHAAGTLVEVSGRVTLATVPAYAGAGADLISVGALTHSAPVLDLGLDVQ